MTFDFHLCKGAYDYNPMLYTYMDMFLDVLSLFFAYADIGDIDPWDTIFEYTDDIWTGFGIFSDIFGWLDTDANQPPSIFEERIDNFYYLGGWKTGRSGTLPTIAPSPELTEFSMLTGWEPDLGGEQIGPYQIQISWNVEIWNHISINCNGYPSCWEEFLFEKSGTSYVNFILF